MRLFVLSLSQVQSAAYALPYVVLAIRASLKESPSDIYSFMYSCAFSAYWSFNMLYIT